MFFSRGNPVIYTATNRDSLGAAVIN